MAGESRVLAEVRSGNWLVLPKTGANSRLRLFCFPYAGGGASLFSSWSDRVPPMVEVVPLQLPGRENHLAEEPFDRIQPLIEALVQVLGPHLDLPFALFGHSMGALVSFELARELRRRGGPSPVHLFVSGARAPHLPNPDPSIRDLPDTEFLAEIDRRYGAAEQLPDNAELRQLIIPVLRADFALCEEYRYQGDDPLDCPISAFGGLNDRKATRDELAAWSAQTGGSFSLRVFPGGHFFIQSSREPFLRVLSQQLYQPGHQLAPAIFSASSRPLRTQSFMAIPR